ncbi:MAG: TIGR03943 family protein [Rhodococcus sp.]|nr:TIGR03943 family protein [Rhodococcus sp. (in: high G+C Gram-positive bacteria)]
MTRSTSNIVLFLIGVMTVKMTWDGSFARYVAVGFRPYLALTGIALIALALSAMRQDLRRAASNASHSHSHSDGVHWLLVCAVVVVAFVAPPPLSHSAVSTIHTEFPAALEQQVFPPLPPGDAPEINLADAVSRAARDSTDSLVDREITVTGFIVRTSNGGAPRSDGSTDGIDLARIRIICCAADARTVRVHLATDTPQLPEGTWVRVRGVVDPQSSTPATRFIPTLHVSDLTEIPAPDNQYMPR